jgi:hypothetical protein
MRTRAVQEHRIQRDKLPFIHPMLELTPADPIIRTYIKDLQRLKEHPVSHSVCEQRFRKVLARTLPTHPASFSPCP